MPDVTLTSAYRDLYGIDDAEVLSVKPIKKGASGRTIMRINALQGQPLVAISYTKDRSDNELHYPMSNLLSSLGVRVPEIVLADLEKQILMVQDIGMIDLLAYKEASWGVREPLYRDTFKELAKLSKGSIPADLETMPPFSEDTYRWEQEYFATHFLGTHLGEKNPEAFLNHPLMKELAQELGQSHPDLVHRDFQSQNLMVSEGLVYFIDFQGARMGHLEYDLASLIYDPYMEHTLEERMKLRDLWSEVSGLELDSELLRKCALQRVMQALGAYGNLTHNQNNQWYAQHIEPARQMLISLTEGNVYEELFHPLIKR